MNLLDAWVVRVHGIPYEKYGKWWIAVTYNCWGQEGRKELMCDTYEEANTIREGHIFQT